MKNYPKMLYADHQTHLIVDDENEEKAARNKGYVDFSDLPEPTKADVKSTENMVTREQYDALAEHAAALEEENLALKAMLNNPSPKPPDDIDYSSMTDDELRQAIADANKSAPMKATREKLIAILKE